MISFKICTVHFFSEKESLRENCPNTEFFSGPYFPVFGLFWIDYNYTMETSMTSPKD